MARTSYRADGGIVQEILSVAAPHDEPRLGQPYAYLAREGEATAQGVLDGLEKYSSVSLDRSERSGNLFTA